MKLNMGCRTHTNTALILSPANQDEDQDRLTRLNTFLSSGIMNERLAEFLDTLSFTILTEMMAIMKIMSIKS